MYLYFCSGLGCSRQQKRHVAAPPPAAVQRRMERNRQKLVGWDKGSLTEQQTKRTATTTVQIRGIHRTNRTTPQRISPGQDRRRTLPSREWVPSAPPPPPEPRMMALGMEYPALFGQVGVGSAHPAVPLLDSGEN